MDFFEAKAAMESLLTGDIARESLEIAEDGYLKESSKDNSLSHWIGVESGKSKCFRTNYNLPARKYNEDNFGVKSRDVPPGEDIKWMCGSCGSTDWTPNERRCPNCKD
jgi:rubrerythrin